MPELSGDELDRAIAEAMGATAPCGYRDFDGTGCHLSLGSHVGAMHEYEAPEFDMSLDALRDGPEKVLREAGLLLSVWQPHQARVNAGWHSDTKAWLGNGGTEAEARARAALAALVAMKERTA